MPADISQGRLVTQASFQLIGPTYKTIAYGAKCVETKQQRETGDEGQEEETLFVAGQSEFNF